MKDARPDALNQNNALRQDAFEGLMAACGPFPDKPRLAVAVSGGPDSIALLHLLHGWIKPRGGFLLAITIDHQLRDDSAAEAQAVQQQCAALDVPHITLHWEKELPPHSALHAKARQARYALLTRCCKAHNLSYLCLAHHADDQAETVLMRLEKKSGVDGIAGMPSTRSVNGVTLLRPLLPIFKYQLEAACKKNGWDYSIDPSNASRKFLRGRLREQAAALAENGLTPQKLYDLAREAGTARAAMEQSVNVWLEKYARLDAYGVIAMDHAAWKSQKPELCQRILIRTLLCVSGEDYAPRGASLEHLTHALLVGDTAHKTLSGCHVEAKDNTIFLYREEDAIGKAVPLQNEIIWDNRFKIVVDERFRNQNMFIAPLAGTSREQLHKMQANDVAALPAILRASLPALYENGVLCAVPSFLATELEQPPVKAIFFPKRSLYSQPFHVPPPILANCG